MTCGNGGIDVNDVDVELVEGGRGNTVDGHAVGRGRRDERRVLARDMLSQLNIVDEHNTVHVSVAYDARRDTTRRGTMRQLP